MQQFVIWRIQVQNIGHFASEQGELDSCLNEFRILESAKITVHSEGWSMVPGQHFLPTRSIEAYINPKWVTHL